MDRGQVFLVVLFFLMCTSNLTMKVGCVELNGTIYIRADGLIDPASANITTADNLTYVFTSNNYGSIVVQRDGIIIDGAGYTLRGPGAGSFDDGINLTKSNGTVIKDLRIENFYEGIEINTCHNTTVLRVTTSDILFQFSDYTIVSDCNLTGGLHLETCSSGTFSNNTFGKVELAMLCWENAFEYNNITFSNMYGLRLADYSHNNTILGNIITNSAKSGLYLGWSSNNTICMNVISNNQGEGIEMDSSDDNIFFNNSILNNQYRGVYIFASHNNTFFCNNFIGNKGYQDKGLHVFSYDSTSSWDNGAFGNYWDNYAGTDSNHDGIGDTPYVMDVSNQDNHPLIAPIVPEISSFPVFLLFTITVLLAVIVYRRKRTR